MNKKVKMLILATLIFILTIGIVYASYNSGSSTITLKGVEYTINKDSIIWVESESGWGWDMLNNPNVLCAQHGGSIKKGWYKADEEKKLTGINTDELMLAYILNHLPADRAQYTKEPSQIAFWQYLFNNKDKSDTNAYYILDNGNLQTTEPGGEEYRWYNEGYYSIESNSQGLSLYNEAVAYAESHNNIEITSFNATVNNNVLTINVSGNFEKYDICINDNIVRQNLALNQSTKSATIAIESADTYVNNDGKIEVKVIAHSNKYTAKYRILKKASSQRFIIVTEASSEDVTIESSTAEVTVNTNVSLQKYITKVVSGNITKYDSNSRANKGTEGNPNLTYKSKISVYNTSNNDSYKNTNPVQIEAGDSVTYRIYVYNNSNFEAKNITVQDTLPNNINLSNVSVSEGSITEGQGTNNITVNVGNLESGGSTYFEVTVEFTVYTTDTLWNVAKIKSVEPPNNPNTIYRTEDGDSIIMATYEVSLEKYISSVQSGSDVTSYAGDKQDNAYKNIINYLRSQSGNDYIEKIDQLRINADINNDEKVNASDLKLLKQYIQLSQDSRIKLSENYKDTDLKNKLDNYVKADINNDGIIDNTDIALLDSSKITYTLKDLLAVREYQSTDINSDGVVDDEDIKAYKIMRLDINQDNVIDKKDLYTILLLNSDFDNDGKITLRDIYGLKAYALSKKYTNNEYAQTDTIEDYIKYDLNADGIVNETDSTVLDSIVIGDQAESYRNKASEIIRKDNKLNNYEDLKNKILETIQKYDINNDNVLDGTDCSLIEKYYGEDYKDYKNKREDELKSYLQSYRVSSSNEEIEKLIEYMSIDQSKLDANKNGQIDENDKTELNKIIGNLDINGNGSLEIIMPVLLTQAYNENTLSDAEKNNESDYVIAKVLSYNDYAGVKGNVNKYKDKDEHYFNNFDINDDGAVNEIDLNLYSNLATINITEEQYKIYSDNKIDNFIIFAENSIFQKGEIALNNVSNYYYQNYGYPDINYDGTVNAKDYGLFKEYEGIDVGDKTQYLNNLSFREMDNSNLLNNIKYCAERSKEILDINKDGNITIEDVLIMRKYVAGTLTIDPSITKEFIQTIIASDIDGDGNFTANDLMLWKNYDFNKLDINDDGNLDNEDINLLVEIINTYNVDKNTIVREIEKLETEDRAGKAEYLTEQENTYIDNTKNDKEWTQHNWDKFNKVVTVGTGDYVTYTIKVTNDSTATSVYITEIIDTLPKGISLYKVGGYSSNDSEYTQISDNDSDRSINITITEITLLAPGESTTVTVTVKVSESNMSLEVFKNTAEISGLKNSNGTSVIDTTPNNNKDSDYFQMKDIVISGTVWNDKALNKTQDNYNGIYDSENEKGKEGIKVYLYRYKNSEDLNEDGKINNTDINVLDEIFNTYKDKADELCQKNSMDYSKLKDKILETIELYDTDSDGIVKTSEIEDLTENLKQYISDFDINGDGTIEKEKPIEISDMQDGGTKINVSDYVIAKVLAYGETKEQIETKIEEYIKHDLNGDGIVDDYDSGVMKEIVLERQELPKGVNADFDNDGSVGTKDSKLLKKFLLSSRSLIKTTTTDDDGNYSFYNLEDDYIKGPKSEGNNRWAGTYYSYYVVFEYDGITYTSTFDTKGKRIWDINENGEKQYSNAQEDGAKVEIFREDFNAKFSTINNESEITYTTTNEKDYIPQSIHKYNPATMAMQSSTDQIILSNSADLESQLQHVNLGLRGRDIFDLELTSDVDNVKVTVNNIQGVYKYSNKVTLRKSDLTSSSKTTEDMANTELEDSHTYVYEDTKDRQNGQHQNIRSSDLDVSTAKANGEAYNQEKGISNIEVTYKITVHNASRTAGTATKITNYYDSKYDYEEVKPGKNCNKIEKVEDGEGGNSHNSKIITVNGEILNQSDVMEIYVVYTLKKPVINTLKGLTKDNPIPTYNMSEIEEYITECASGQTEYTRGLIDKDSAPGSAYTEKAKLSSTRTTILTTVEYYFGEFGAKDLSKLKYEDDTYATPILYFVVPYDDNGTIENKDDDDYYERTITGTVFEDKTTVNPETKIKTGNGKLDKGEVGVYGATVELVELKTDNKPQNIAEDDGTVRYTVQTDKDGKFTISGFLPGYYVIRYRYGDTINTVLLNQSDDKTVNKKSYNGEDYQSTNNAFEVQDEDGNVISNILDRSKGNLWYVTNEKEEEGISTGTDNEYRRYIVHEKVMGYGLDYKNVLNDIRNGKILEKNDDIDTIIADTNMYATTPQMLFTVEKTINLNELGKEDKDKLIGSKQITVKNDNSELGEWAVFPNKNSEYYKKYEIRNMNFGIAELPKTTINLEKHVKSFTLYDSTGNNLIAGLTIDENRRLIKTGDVITAPPGVSRATFDVSVEGEKLQGAKLRITYEISTKMDSEINYNGILVPTKITEVVDYIDNNLSYNPTLGENGENWQITTYSELNKDGKGLQQSDENEYTTIVKAKEDNPILLKGDGTGKVTITLEKILSSPDTTIEDIITSTVDIYKYSNTVEITKISQPHDDDPTTDQNPNTPDSDTNPNPPDTPEPLPPTKNTVDKFPVPPTQSEDVTIHPPTGDSGINTIYYIIVVISLVILAAGAFCIKKFVLKNNE